MMPRQRGELTDQQVIALWLKEQDPATQERIKALSHGIRVRLNGRTPKPRETIGEGAALELLYRIGLVACVRET